VLYHYIRSHLGKADIAFLGILGWCAARGLTAERLINKREWRRR